MAKPTAVVMLRQSLWPGESHDATSFRLPDAVITLVQTVPRRTTALYAKAIARATMDVETFRILLSDRGQLLLAEITARGFTEATTLALATDLRRRYPAPLVAAAMTQARLRLRAVEKFGPDAATMYFTQAGLEQATSAPVAAHHAARFRAIGRVADLCCGIGGDLRALAASHTVLAVDHDPLTVAIAAANVAALGLSAQVSVACDDVTAVDLTGYDAAFLDPARRTAARRVFNMNDYQPPWSFVLTLAKRVGNLGIKLAPGIPHAIIPPEAEAEWLSVRGDVKEAALWFGALRTGAPRRATLLPSGATLTARIADPPPVGAPRRYLYEPDGAVIRAHLVADVAAIVGGTLIDRTIAYVTSDNLIRTPFARAYAIEDTMPFNLKRLRAALRERGIGHVTIKKRGSPLTPEALLRDLRLHGENHCILFLTRVGGVHTALLGRLAEDEG